MLRYWAYNMLAVPLLTSLRITFTHYKHTMYAYRQPYMPVDPMYERYTCTYVCTHARISVRTSISRITVLNNYIRHVCGEDSHARKRTRHCGRARMTTKKATFRNDRQTCNAAISVCLEETESDSVK